MNHDDHDILATDSLFSRRGLITGALALSAAAMLPGGAFAATPRPKPRPRGILSEGRNLSFSHLHTGERCKVTYFENGRYLPDALEEINRLLRDFRTDEVTEMDPKLLDLLYTLRGKLETSRPFEIISAYRSPTTNSALREKGRGVAKNSYHLKGQAIDIRVDNRSISQVRNAALAMEAGGVGYYRRSGFVHVDTGPVRKWG